MKKSSPQVLLKMIFTVIIFFCAGCTSNKQPLLSACLTMEEKADLEYFLRSLIFENYGAFVLFGSKPLCQMHLSDEEVTGTEPTFQKWLDSLPEDKRREFEAVANKAHRKRDEDAEPERNLYRGWLALEKVRETFKIKNFIFRLIPVHFPDSDELIPGSYDLTLINIQQTVLVLAENYETFKAASNMDFHPSQVVFEAQNPSSLFWKNIFSINNHLAKGLLFGFGLKNSLFFHWHPLYSRGRQTIESHNYAEAVFLQSHRFEFSTVPTGFRRSSPSNFTIPMFRTVAEDDTAERYKKEKVAIEKTYRGQDVVEITLRRLTGL